MVQCQARQASKEGPTDVPPGNRAVLQTRATSRKQLAHELVETLLTFGEFGESRVIQPRSQRFAVLEEGPHSAVPKQLLKLVSHIKAAVEQALAVWTLGLQRFCRQACAQYGGVHCRVRLPVRKNAHQAEPTVWDTTVSSTPIASHGP